jgi:hypothetical protein
MANFLYGSICLTDAIESGQCKKVLCKDGKERIYLSIQVVEKKEAQVFNDKKYTHFVSCAPKQDERKDGVNYIIGDLQTYQQQQSVTPSHEEIQAAPSATFGDLPF